MTNYTAFYTEIGGRGDEVSINFAENGEAPANAFAARFARDNVLALTAVVDTDEAAGPLPLAA